jgi:single-strand DNA-binding protein
VHRERLTYSVDEAASLLGISRAKAYECVRTGQLRAVQLGRRFVVPAAALDGLLGLSDPPSEAEALNQVEVVGRLTRDPQNRQARSGTQVGTIRIAIGGRDAETTVFIDVVAFGSLTEELEFLTKGQRVRVCGRLDQRKWLGEDGSRRSVHQIIARRIEALEPPRWEPAAS